ncbi:MAG: Rieske (2Fe-2S) protein [Chromatiaceae bacterium]|nr:MAG: Rieske (2Fe-2S) protein [Chromatiaceae bacterium]
MNANAADWIDLGPVAELPDPSARGFQIGGLAGVLVHRSGSLRAWRDRCPHIGAPLAWTPDRYPGDNADQLQCTLHGALFRVDSGACVQGPCLGDALTALPIVVRDGRILLDLLALADDEDDVLE